MKPKYVALSLILSSQIALAQSARFSGGACASQGDWVQSALSQSASIVSTLETLRDDPNCSALVKTLDNSADLKALAQNQDADTSGLAGISQELQAIGQYINPGADTGLNPSGFRDVVNYMVFRKSLDTVNNIYITRQTDGLSESQKQNVDYVSQRLKSFLSRSATISNMAVSTTKSIMAALPNSKLCFSNRPNEAALIFSSLVSSTAALVSGGQITNVGEMVSSITQFERQMHFANILSGVELERYRASMSCLVESTQENYCALVDAQNALNFNKTGGVQSSGFVEKDPDTASEASMQGLMVLLRDTPIVTSWMQKVLFGIDPKIIIEAKMKNENWDSVINFIKTKNTLYAIYRDKKQIYYQSTKGLDTQTKAMMVKDIIDALVNAMGGGDFNSGGGSNNNFFTNLDRMPFILMGIQTPADFNTRMNPFENIYLKWSSEQSNGLNNPDAIVEGIADHLNQVIEQASSISSGYFSSRMIVDSMNLIVDGMNGPSVSPYKALFHIRTYLTRLNQKLQKSLNDTSKKQSSINQSAYSSFIPMINDTIGRIDRITNAMDAVAKIQVDDDDDTTEAASRKQMDIIYEAANMLNSRDSFIGNRVATAVKMDITDTLWRNEHLDPKQAQVLSVMGKDVITYLSRYFNNDPILQRLDVAQATPIHIQNLSAVESLFVRNYWDQLTDINCSLYGGAFCSQKSSSYAPDQSFLESFVSTVTDNFTFAPLRNFTALFSSPKNDSDALYNLRAKLCAQTLGFETYYSSFKSLCKGATIVSEFSQGSDHSLDFSYDASLKQLEDTKNSTAQGHLSESRVVGTCSLRSYIRKNLIYRMYSDIK